MILFDLTLKRQKEYKINKFENLIPESVVIVSGILIGISTFMKNSNDSF